jgi:PAS domain S-box-containing protein
MTDTSSPSQFPVDSLEALRNQLAEAQARNGELEECLKRKDQELQQLQITLKETQEWFQVALSASEMAVWEHDLNENTSTISNKAFDFYGIGPEELKSRDKSFFNWTDVESRQTAFNWVYSDDLLLSWIHPDDRELVRQADQEALRTGIFEAEYRSLHSNGDIRWIYSLGKVLYNESQQPFRIYGVEFDITTPKSAEIALKGSEEKIRQLTEAIQDVFWVRSLTQELLYVSPAYETIWGRSVESLYQNLASWREAIHPEDRDQAYTVNSEHLQEGLSVEYRVVRPDGEIRWVQDRAFAVRDAQGQVYRIAGVAKDISKRKQIEAQLRASLEEKMILLKEVHHRVKNNMQIVSSLLNLQAASIEDPQILEFFQECQNRIKALALVHEELYASESIASVNFAEYIQKLVKNLLYSYVPASLTITPILNLEAIGLDIDTVLSLSLIINELVSNAIKHAFPGRSSGEIQVDFSRNEEGYCTLTVKDDGVGLPESLDFSNTETLGLQLVCSFVVKLRGQITLDPNQRRAFTITFKDSV